MFVVIKNSNENFSHLIGKNPASGPKLMSERRGVACGWFHDNNTYCINFVDAPDEVSYPEYQGQEFEYLAKGGYCSPFLAYKLVKEFMKLNEEHDCTDENPSYNSVEIYSVSSKDSSIELFQKYFQEYQIRTECSKSWDKFKKLKIGYLGRFSEFCDFLKVFLFYLSLDNENYFIHEDLIMEQFKRIQHIDAPYFIRYLFKQNYCKNSPNKFDQIKEFINSNKYDFCPLNNLEARIRFIKNHCKDTNVYDIGCGEGIYLKRLVPDNLSYTGIDIDSDVLELAQKKGDKSKFENWRLLPAISYDDDCEKTVVLSEVIEHIEPEHIPEFMRDVMKLSNVERFIITTPNAAFNHNYQIDGFRHEDHKFEWNRDQLEDFVNTYFLEKYTVTYYDIGDIVDGEPTTLGVVIE